MAVLYFHSGLRSQCRSVQYLPVDLDRTLYGLPGDLDRNGTPSSAVVVLGYCSDGAGDDCEYVCLCLRPSLGSLGGQIRKLGFSW